MKKKAIEQIAFKRPRGNNDSVAHVETLSGERILMLDEWRDGKPFQRYVLTDKEFGHFVNNKWQMVRFGYHGQFGRISESSKKVVTQFCKGKVTRNWDCYIRNAEYMIDMARVERKRELREERLAQRCNSLYPLPIAWEQYLEEVALPDHHLYYTKKGRYAKVFCSACGEEYEICIKAKDTYEGMFETVHQSPEHRAKGMCQKCKAVGTYIAAGKEKHGSSEDKNIYLVQKTKDNAIVVRYFEAVKQYGNGQKDSIECTEVVRGFIKNGKLQKDYNKYDYWNCKNSWDDCNLYGLANIQMYNGIIHPASWNVLSEGQFKYIDVKKIINNAESKETAYIIANIAARPQIEMLQKMGFDWAVNRLSRWYSPGLCFDMNAKKAWDFFKVNKDRLPMLKQNEDYLEILQFERKRDIRLTEDEIQFLSIVPLDDVQIIMEYMSLQQCMNRTYKYAEVKPKKKLSFNERDALHRTIRLYRDYLNIRHSEGYDMTNSVYLHPRDLQGEHDKLVEERERKRNEEYLKQMEDKFKQIPKQYKKLKAHFEYSDGNLYIRPARTATEIIEEGRVQHHCVGGQNYLSKHDKGQSFILFLRYEKDKAKAYYTIEMKYNYEVMQFYAAHDKQPNKDEIWSWLQQYKKQMIAKKQKNTKTSNRRMAKVS